MDKLELLCPVRALRAYVRPTASIRRSDRLFLCYSGPNKGRALSRQRRYHLRVEANRQAYGAGNCTLLSGLKVPLYQECPHDRGYPERSTPGRQLCRCPVGITGTFSRLYWVNVDTPHQLGVVLSPESSDSTP